MFLEKLEDSTYYFFNLFIKIINDAKENALI